MAKSSSLRSLAELVPGLLLSSLIWWLILFAVSGVTVPLERKVDVQGTYYVPELGGERSVTYYVTYRATLLQEAHTGKRQLHLPPNDQLTAKGIKAAYEAAGFSDVIVRPVLN